MVTHARALTAAVTAIAVLGIATGCIMPPPLPVVTPSADDEGQAPLEPASAIPELTAAAEIAWSVPSEGASGSPVIVGDRVVTYELSATDDLVLSGFDLASGARVWSVPASTNDMFRGQLSPHILEDSLGQPRVVTVSPSYELETAEYFYLANDVRVIDPATGAVIASRDGGLASEIMRCEVESAFCFWNWDVAAETSTRMVVDGDGGFQEHGAALGYVDELSEWRGVTSSIVVVTADDGSESLVRYVDGAASWTVPVAELGFDELASSWIQAHELDEEGLAIIQSNGAPAAGESYTIPAGAFSVAIVDMETGETVAQHERSIICATTSLCVGDVTLDVSTDANGAEQTDWTFENVTLTAFDDFRTGTEEWTVSYPSLAFLPGTDPDNSTLGWEDLVFIDTPESQELLDWATGERYAVEAGDVFGCFQPRAIESKDADIWSEPSTYWIDAVGVGCDASGVVVEDPAAFTSAVVGGIGGWTWLPEAAAEALDEEDPYGYIEFIPVHVQDALVLFRR